MNIGPSGPQGLPGIQGPQGAINDKPSFYVVGNITNVADDEAIVLAPGYKDESDQFNSSRF